MQKWIAAAFAAGLSLNAFALSSSQVASEFKNVLEPFYSTGHEIHFHGVNGIALEGRDFIHPSPSRGTIIVANGYGETFHKYVEVAYDLYLQGYSVFLYDHRGQGESQHLLPDPQRAHIDAFENLVTDLDNFIEQIVKPSANGPYYLLGHSMGGLVSARYLEEHHDVITAAVLSAPMLGINFHGWGFQPLKWLLDFASFFGEDTFYVQSPANPLRTSFVRQTVTHNQVRYQILNLGIRALDPSEMVWGNTARWVDQSFHAGDLGVENARAVTTPVVMFQAGQDELVMPEPENQFCAAAPNCKLTRFATSRHEILMENDEIRANAMARILTHFGADRPLPVDKNEILF